MIISDVALYLFVSLMNTVIAYSEFNNERDDVFSSPREDPYIFKDPRAQFLLCSTVPLPLS